MKSLYESILDDEEELIGKAKDAFKNWIAFISCMYFEKDWDDDQILEYLNSKYVMSFFPSLKRYEWKYSYSIIQKNPQWIDHRFEDSKKLTHYVLQDSKESTAVTLVLNKSNVQLQIDCSYFDGRELTKLKRRLESDCKMKLTHIPDDSKQQVIYYIPKNNDYWKDRDSFK